MLARPLALSLTLALSCVLLEKIKAPVHVDQKERGKADAPRQDFYGDPLPVGTIVRLGTIRLRHAAAVRGLVWAGEQLVSIGADGWTHRWEVATGKRLVGFRSPTDRMPWTLTEGPMALSADGKRVAVVKET